MRSESASTENPSSAARTIPTSPSAGGSAPKTSNRAIHSSIHAKRCEWCGETFVPRTKHEERTRRFCGRSCSAKWRMRQPEYLAKVHNPEVAKRRGESRRAWLASGNPRALAEIARIRNLNPTAEPAVRAKISRTLKAMHHGPSVRGGNGRGLTVPQRILLDALGSNWAAEYALSLGKRTPGYPTHYKIDLANVALRVAIEVDGNCHHSRKALDAKKDAKLSSLGWTVLRFWNADILTWRDSGMPAESSISTTLAQHGIHPSRSMDA